MLHAEQLASEDDAIEARKRLVTSVYAWQQASTAAAAPLVNVVCDIIQVGWCSSVLCSSIRVSQLASFSAGDIILVWMRGAVAEGRVVGVCCH